MDWRFSNKAQSWKQTKVNEYNTGIQVLMTFHTFSDVPVYQIDLFPLLRTYRLLPRSTGVLSSIYKCKAPLFPLFLAFN